MAPAAATGTTLVALAVDLAASATMGMGANAVTQRSTQSARPLVAISAPSIKACARLCLCRVSSGTGVAIVASVTGGLVAPASPVIRRAFTVVHASIRMCAAAFLASPAGLARWTAAATATGSAIRAERAACVTRGGNWVPRACANGPATVQKISPAADRGLVLVQSAITAHAFGDSAGVGPATQEKAVASLSRGQTKNRQSE